MLSMYGQPAERSVLLSCGRLSCARQLGVSAAPAAGMQSAASLLVQLLVSSEL